MYLLFVGNTGMRLRIFIVLIFC